MKLNNILSAAVLAAVMPFAASAATVSSAGVMTVNGADTGVLADYLAGNNEIDIIAGGSFQARFFEDDVAGVLNFELWNTSGVAQRVAVIDGNIDQNPGSYGFFGGVDIWFNGANSSFGVVDEINLDYSAIVDANDYVLFSIDYGDPQSNSLNLGSFIDFTVQSSAVPLPAAGFLLLGALGGLAAVRRKS